MSTHPPQRGRFRILRRLGSGGMGEVFLAQDPATGVEYALKSLSAGDATDQERLRREAQSQAKVDRHPHVLRIHAFEEDALGSFLVLELARGGDLAGRLEAGPLEPTAAAELIRDLARGVQHMHETGILHRDLKPANVLFDEQGTAKLCDFGLVLPQDEDRLSQTGTILGTPEYMAPEQADGRRDQVGPTTDVYGLGALLYHCTTGRPPFKAGSVIATLNQVLSYPPRPPRELNPEIPRRLAAITLRCLAKDAAERPPSAEALATELESFLLAPQSRRTWPVLALGLGAALVVAFLAAFVSRPALAPVGPRAAVSAIPRVSPVHVPEPAAAESPDPRQFPAGVWEVVPLGADDRAKLDRFVEALTDPPTLAARWRRVAEALDPEDRSDSLLGLPENHTEAFYAYLRAAEAGHLGSASRAGRALVFRAVELPSGNVGEWELSLFHFAALNGDVGGMRELARLYAQPMGFRASGDVERDEATAAGWFYLSRSEEERDDPGTPEFLAGWEVKAWPNSERQAWDWVGFEPSPAGHR